MNDIHKVLVRSFIVAVLCCLFSGEMIAQGPPVFLDSCMVTNAQRFKALPVPGEFQPGSMEALRSCPNLGNTTVKIAKARAGVARNLKMELRIQNGKLMEVQAVSYGFDFFERLYEQVIRQAGNPSKMVESDGVRTYSWELRERLNAVVFFHYEPAAQRGTVIITAP